jgi:hypothetical protein
VPDKMVMASSMVPNNGGVHCIHHIHKLIYLRHKEMEKYGKNLHWLVFNLKCSVTYL